MSELPQGTILASFDRVRRSTEPRVNEQIDNQTEANIRCYADSNKATSRRRIHELDEE